MSGDGGVRVVVADDHPVVRQGLTTLLSSLLGVEVVGEAADGMEAVAQCERHQPDVIVMDLNMPNLDGIEATRRIVAAIPEVAVLVLTMFDDDASLFAALRAGARGHILKGADQADIARAIAACARGEVIFGPAMAARVLDVFTGVAEAPASAFPELTEREREILELIASGVNNARIAQRLGLSVKTVRNHSSNIFTKLQVTDRAQAIIRARDGGLGH
jgi:DNA-binding NarL/FixJ family response regulator